ncbi:MAG: trigger factor [Clostridia bacterium]|nr:trigger factor [Clostridia bacterium]
MSYTVEKIASNKIKLTFTESAEAFEAAMQKAYLKTRGKINVPGFRKGKAPRKLIENMYGEAVFYDDAFEIIAQPAYDEAIKADSLNPVDRPEVNIQEIGTGKELKYTIEVFVKPDITLGEYKGVEVQKNVKPITEEAINARIDSDVERASTTQDVTDRAVENGDIVNLDYAGTVDGVAFEGGTAQNQTLTIGSGMFIPGFEEQMVGMAIGEEKDLTVKFPEQYHAAELAGKDAVFHVKVNGIQEKVKPAMDDDFAADVSEFDTFEAYRQNIVETLEKNEAERAEAELEDSLVQKVVDAADCDIPSAMIEDEVTTMLREMEMRMAYQGIRFEDYLKYTGQTVDQVREQYKGEATNRVKTQLVLEAIAKAESIEASDADHQAAIADQAQRMGQEAEAFKASLSEGQLAYLRETAGIKKTIDFLKENAVITEKAEEKPEEKPAKKAKKAPAKKAAKKEEAAQEPAEDENKE